jgi:hypothetical protein
MHQPQRIDAEELRQLRRRQPQHAPIDRQERHEVVRPQATATSNAATRTKLVRAWRVKSERHGTSRGGEAASSVHEPGRWGLMTGAVPYDGADRRSVRSDHTGRCSVWGGRRDPAE